MSRLFDRVNSSPEASGNPRPPGDGVGRRAGAFWLGAAFAGWTIVALTRVLPYIPTSGGDFEHFHRGAAALIAGQGAYFHAALDYPPLLPVLLAPLGFLPLDAARYLWLGLSLAALLAAMAATWRLAGGDVAAAGAVAVVLALDGSAIPNLALGQINPLLLLLLALALLLHASRPGRAAAAIGLAAALKIWPGMLLLSFLPARRSGRFAAWRSGLAVALLGVLAPWALLVVATPPPHLPTTHGYWLGTPALLNFSAPAAILRASYAWEPGSAFPPDWIAGVSANWSLAPERQRRSVVASLLVLGSGLAALALRWRGIRSQRRERRQLASEPGASPGEAGVELAGALVALALLAAPIAWYHYQLLQLPAFVLALAVALRRRQWGTAIASSLLLAVLTHHEWVVAILELGGSDPDLALYRTGIVLPLLGVIWFGSRLRALGNERP